MPIPFVALVNPPSPGTEVFAREGRCQERLGGKLGAYPPLTLAYVSSVLRANGVPCAAFDLEADRGGLGRLEAAIDEAGRGALVIINTTTPTLASDMSYAGGLKERHPGSLLVAIGAHVTALPAETLRSFPWLDAAVVGEPEQVVLDAAASGGPAGVSGMVWRDPSGQPVHGGPREPVMELDALPFPDWGDLPLDKYVMPLTGERYVMVQTSRGCPHRCTFCVSRLWYGGKLRQRSAEGILDEMEHDVAHHGAELLYLFGDTVTQAREQVLQVCRGMVERGLDVKWLCNSRVDSVDAELLDAMADAGCFAISFGIESSDPSILGKARKGASPEQAERAVTEARDRGIVTTGFFVFGLPGETEATIERTIEFASELPLDFAEFYPALPYPGTELELQLFGEKRRDADWAALEYSTPVRTANGMDPAALSGACRRGYRRFYSRPGRVWRLASMVPGPAMLSSGAQFVRGRFL
ncbi:MAG: radical SAM protein [Candidatus Undinarchaeales archaeon]|nr:radical SAM protein [Candidatus Undinarchaeales archaeon]MDP7493277.1 radical SAM protein [Candidatus Undinarchaeales archaeon]